MSTRKKVPSYPPAHLQTVAHSQARRKILRDGARANELRDHAFRRILLSIPIVRGDYLMILSLPRRIEIMTAIMSTRPVSTV